MNELISEWVTKAEEDWRVANREIKVEQEPAYNAVCYHAQQCAEKYMKAFLLFHSIRPEFNSSAGWGLIVSGNSSPCWGLTEKKL